MIRHIVFFSAKDPENAGAIHAGLSKLGDIPHSAKFEVSLNRRATRSPTRLMWLFTPSSPMMPRSPLTERIRSMLKQHGL